MYRGWRAAFWHVCGHNLRSIGVGCEETPTRLRAEANMQLSKARADAVVTALATKYHIAPGRLHAAGIGPLAPVATNRGEDGRAKNRRVELVEQ